MKPENKYPLMGKWVEVRACMKARKKGGRRDHILHVLLETRVGLVTGYRTVYDGRVESTHQVSPCDGQPYPPYFVPTNPQKVLLVVFWPTMNPVLVRPEDAKVLYLSINQPVSNSKYHSTQPKWSNVSRTTLRQIMKGVPRDARGRWKK